MHVIAAKAVAFGEALRPAFKLYARNVVENAKALAETLKSKGLDIVSGGTNPSHAADLAGSSYHQVAELALGRAYITQTRTASRSTRRSRRSRQHPAGDAGRHHLRLRHRRIPGGRRPDRGARRARRSRSRRSADRGCAARSEGLVARFPIYNGDGQRMTRR